MNELKSPTHQSLSRRNLLGGALAAGAGAALVGVPGVGAVAHAATKPGEGTKPEKRPATVFFKDERLNFQMLFAIGGAGDSVSEVG